MYLFFWIYCWCLKAWQVLNNFIIFRSTLFVKNLLLTLRNVNAIPMMRKRNWNNRENFIVNQSLSNMMYLLRTTGFNALDRWICYGYTKTSTTAKAVWYFHHSFVLLFWKFLVGQFGVDKIMGWTANEDLITLMGKLVSKTEVLLSRWSTCPTSHVLRCGYWRWEFASFLSCLLQRLEASA